MAAQGTGTGAGQARRVDLDHPRHRRARRPRHGRARPARDPDRPAARQPLRLGARATSDALIAMALGLPTYSLFLVLMRAYQAVQDTRDDLHGVPGGERAQRSCSTSPSTTASASGPWRPVSSLGYAGGALVALVHLSRRSVGSGGRASPRDRAGLRRRRRSPPAAAWGVSSALAHLPGGTRQTRRCGESHRRCGGRCYRLSARGSRPRVRRDAETAAVAESPDMSCGEGSSSSSSSSASSGSSPTTACQVLNARRDVSSAASAAASAAAQAISTPTKPAQGRGHRRHDGQGARRRRHRLHLRPGGRQGVKVTVSGKAKLARPALHRQEPDRQHQVVGVRAAQGEPDPSGRSSVTVKVVTDSSCDLPQELADELGHHHRPADRALRRRGVRRPPGPHGCGVLGPLRRQSHAAGDGRAVARRVRAGLPRGGRRGPRRGRRDPPLRRALGHAPSRPAGRRGGRRHDRRCAPSTRSR